MGISLNCISSGGNFCLIFLLSCWLMRLFLLNDAFHFKRCFYVRIGSEIRNKMMVYYFVA